jgi:hypothetical protein
MDRSFEWRIDPGADANEDPRLIFTPREEIENENDDEYENDLR